MLVLVLAAAEPLILMPGFMILFGDRNLVGEITLDGTTLGVGTMASIILLTKMVIEMALRMERSITIETTL